MLLLGRCPHPHLSRCRRAATAAGIVGAMAAAAGCGGTSHEDAERSGVATLRNGVVLAELVRINETTADVRVVCGVRLPSRRPLPQTVVAIDLRRVAFEWESNPRNPAQGHVSKISRADWERRARQSGWSGMAHIERSRGYLTNGPNPDVCGGATG